MKDSGRQEGGELTSNRLFFYRVKAYFLWLIARERVAGLGGLAL